MPATRKSSRLSSGSGKQSTLSFNHRVTKIVPKSGKESAVSAVSVAAAKKHAPQEVAPAEPKLAEEPEDSLAEEEPQRAQAAEPVPEKTDAELRAEKVSKTAIARYWRTLESQRIAKRVHQEGLTTHEKILRYFDVSSQYGPCIGISRTKRWLRAERLGLDPPIEVLAVLIKESSENGRSVQKAHIDEIMNPTAVDVV